MANVKGYAETNDSISGRIDTKQESFMRLAKLRLEPIKHDLALIKEKRTF